MKRLALLSAAGAAVVAVVATGGAVLPASAAASAATSPAPATPSPATPSPAAYPACRVQPLPVPAGSGNSGVNAGDPTGRYLVGDAVLVGPDTTRQVNLFWVDGRLTDFPTPYPNAVLVDVNRRGAVVGYTQDAGAEPHAWRYRDGRFTELPGLNPTDRTIPRAINSAGDAVGISADYTVNPPVHRAVVWPVSRPGTVREVTVPRQVPGWAQANDIDDDGTIIGEADDAALGRIAFVSPPRGSARALRGPAGTSNVSAVAIRNGWVAGWENQAAGSVPVRWRARTGAAEQIAGGNSGVYSVNSRGSVGMQDAVAHRSGRIVPLPALWDNGARGAKALSDRGTAAGFGYDGSQVRAVVWTGC